jgi:hypothetical protein
MRAGHDAAARLALSHLEPPRDPDGALRAGLELWELCPAAFEGIDRARERDVEMARSAWNRLRKRLAR